MQSIWLRKSLSLDFGAWPVTRRKLFVAGCIAVGIVGSFSSHIVSTANDLFFHFTADGPSGATAAKRGMEAVSARALMESELLLAAKPLELSYSSILQCIHSATREGVLIRYLLIDMYAGAVELSVELNNNTNVPSVLALLNSNNCSGQWLMRSLTSDADGVGVVVMEVRGEL